VGNDAITASWPGNGSYGPVTSSPLTQSVTQPVSGPVYIYAATYDATSNISSYTDSVMGTMNFTYDTLNRVATATGNEPGNPYPNFCWNYDSFGNRTMQMSANVAFPGTMGGPMAAACQTTGGTGPQWSAQYNGTVNGTNNNQMSSTSTNVNQGQGYDAAGNITNDGASQYWYDGEGRVCEVLNTLVGVTTAYIYDAEGRRVAKGTADWQNCDPSTNHFLASTDYVLGPAGEQVTEVTLVNGVATGVAHTNAWAGGMLLATYDVNGLHFYLTDPLGSRRVQTNYAGVLEQTCQSLPFGDWETCTPSPTEHLFTGKERDQESGNDYFGARYYASTMGRFLSPDPLLNSGRPDDPQTWNRYSYTLNNPLRYTDPLGLYVWGSCAYDAEKCKADQQRFRDSITTAQKALNGLKPGSDEAKQLKKTLDKLGEEGKGNIKINFGDAGKTDGESNLGRTVGNSVTINYDAVDSETSGYHLSASESAALDAGVTTHEGTHAGGGPSILGLLGMHGEHAAYFTESVTYQGLHNTDRLFQLWNESWLKVDQHVLEQNRESAIQNILHPPKQQTEQKLENPQ
jgi:RHS repeat-associated protein